MRVLFDTNVIVDVLQKREPHFENSYRVFQMAAKEDSDITGLVAASILTDIYYVIRPSLGSKAAAREAIRQLTELLMVCDTQAVDAAEALDLPMEDFEDAIVAAVGKREKADVIVTRNTKDFAQSPVPAITPDEFLMKYGT